MEGRERLGGWQEDGGSHRGAGWERDRERDRDRDRDRERDRDRDRRDWRDRRSSLDRDKERGRGGDDGERDHGRVDGADRARGDGGSRERGRAEGKEGDRPKRSERRERTTRWDRDDRLAELENMERFRTSNSTEQPCAAPLAPTDTSKDNVGVESSAKNAESELIAVNPEVPAAKEVAPSEPSPSAQGEATDNPQEAAAS